MPVPGLRDVVRLYPGDCLEVLPRIASASVDAVISDPPYPEIDRDYGRMTEKEWFAMMAVVVRECRRILKPLGSAVFILQPNRERVGRMRTWLWYFMAWLGEEWNIVQDVWWWNKTALPMTNCDPNALRASVKACVWVGEPNCYRDALQVLCHESDSNRGKRKLDLPNHSEYRTGGQHIREARTREAVLTRGGTQPFNLLPIANSNSSDSAGTNGHGAGTPSDLYDWWLQYIVPPGGKMLDPFAGSGTAGIAAMAQGKTSILIEKHLPYVDMIRRRLRLTNDVLRLETI
jgi:DNA modification methylase